MPSLAASVEKAVGVDDDDPGELLAVYECIYAGKPLPAKPSEAENVDAEARAIVSGLFGGEDKENVAEDAETTRGKPAATAKTNAARVSAVVVPSAPEGENTVFHPPHVGRLKMHADALHFEADMFGLDLTSLKLMRWQIQRADAAPARYAVTVVDWHGVPHDFQLHKQAAELHDLMVRAWRLERAAEDGEPPLDPKTNAASSARNPLCQDPADPASKIGREALEARERLRARLAARRNSLRGRAASFAYPYVRESLRLYKAAAKTYKGTKDFLFPPPPPPPPFLPLTDVCARTNVCLFVRVEKGESLLAMDAGGVSDPFATARWGALECTTEIKYETVDPVWDETFVFELGSIGEVVDEDLTLCLYDYDLALNDFLGFVRVDLRGKKVADAKDWSREGKWYSVEALPEGYGEGVEGGAGFDWGRVKDQLMFWEGKREYTGRVKIAAWVGTRDDEAMRVASRPKPWRPTERSREDATFYVEPLTAALHVLVSQGRDILAMDGSKDDPGGLSDPYCEVVLEHEKTQKLETEQTHYVDDADAPEWDRKFSFVISRPYTQNTLWFKVYDYDGGFDQFIGQVKLKCEDLEIHRGLVKPPAAKWYTLYDAAEKDTNAEGEPYGEILLAAYIDEEYLEHMHHQPQSPLRLGHLDVDIFRVWDVPEPSSSDVFVVAKYGPWWARLPTRAEAAGPEREARYDARLRFPALDLQVPVIVAAFAGEGETPRLLGKIKVPLAALETNQRYFKVVDLGSIDAAGAIAAGGKLDVALTYGRDADDADSSFDLLKQYLRPTCSDKWYLNPIPELEQEKVAKRHKELVIHALCVAATPPVRDAVAREMLDFSRHEFNARVIQTSIARLQCVVGEGLEILNAIHDVFSWRNPYVTAFVQIVLFLMINKPRLFAPGCLFLLGAVPLVTFPSRRARALAQISTDMDVSVGKLPPHLEMLLNGDSLTNEQMKALEKDAAKRASADAAAEAARVRAEAEKAAAAAKKEEDDAVAAILADADAESEADSDDDQDSGPKTAGSLNPFTNLMRQYEELTTMITSIQSAMDNVATVLEQILGVLSWKEPRVTFFAMCALMLSSVGYFGAQTLVETALRIARSVGGKAVVTAKSSTRLGKAVTVVVDVYAFAWRTYLEKPYDVVVAFADETTESARAFASRIWGLFTLKAILEVSRLAGSVYMLYALRHPAILPDQSAQFKSASKSVEVDQAAEARKKAETEAAAKKASAEAEASAGGAPAAPEASKEKKKTRAEREAEAERERRRAARAAKKEARRKQKEKEEAEKKAKAAGAGAIDRRPPAPLNAFARIPSRGYQIL